MLHQSMISTPISPLSQIKPKTDHHLRTLKQNLTISSSYSAASSADDDAAYNSRGFAFHRTATGLNLDHLNRVFVSVGFPRRDPEKIRVALEHTDSVVWVEDVKRQKPVAFARATGDGVFNAIIWDVVVEPGFQGIGLGKAVMERIIVELLKKGVTNIALYSEPRVLGFYRPLGFVSDPDGIKAMVYSRKPKTLKN